MTEPDDDEVDARGDKYIGVSRLWPGRWLPVSGGARRLAREKGRRWLSKADLSEAQEAGCYIAHGHDGNVDWWISRLLLALLLCGLAVVIGVELSLAFGWPLTWLCYVTIDCWAGVGRQ
jgi:hypothetical protein